MPDFERNHCLASEIVLGATSPASAPRTPERRSTSARKGASRVQSEANKVAIVQRYHAWVLRKHNGGPSPITELMREFNCSRNYPKKLYDRFLARGTVNNAYKGNPVKKYDPAELGESIRQAIRLHHIDQRTASSTAIQTHLKAHARLRNEPIPSKSTINRAKKRLGTKVKKVQKRPMLTRKLMSQREAFAMAHSHDDMSRTVVIDEKWFSEEKGRSLRYEICDNSPLPPSKVRYKAFQAETNTQAIKLMYLCAVCDGNPIGLYEVDFVAFNKARAKEKGGAPAKGLGRDQFQQLMTQVAADARRALGAGPIRVWADRAPCHTAKATQAHLSGLFDEIVFQPGKSPDFNMCDAHVFPVMERAVETARAKTKDQIRATVTRLWTHQITGETLAAAARRVKRNMQSCAAMRGGNFFND